MSVFKQKYRRYTGELKGRWHKIWAIAKSTFKVQYRGRKVFLLTPLGALLSFVFTLVLFFGAIFAGSVTNLFFGLFEMLDIAMYTIVFMSFSSGLLFLPLVFFAVFNSGTIANDKKNNSLALYMSRPLDKIDYILGKFIATLMVNSFVTILPWLLFLVTYTLLGGLTGSQIIDIIWVYPATLGIGLVIDLFFSSIIVYFSSLSDRSFLAGLMLILVILIPSTIADTLAITLNLDFLNYFSVSALINATTFLFFGKPSDDLGLGVPVWDININSWVSLTILLAITAVCFILTVINLYKEEID
ncbi:MAG: ABC-2 transporter permease [Asgard group archaeon]|nr:ABC-2 transporter permease [Asgard group archaeon]